MYLCPSCFPTYKPEPVSFLSQPPRSSVGLWPLGKAVLGIWCHLVDTTRKASSASAVVASDSHHEPKQLPNMDYRRCFSPFFRPPSGGKRQGNHICIVFHAPSPRKTSHREITDHMKFGSPLWDQLARFPGGRGYSQGSAA